MGAKNFSFARNFSKVGFWSPNFALFLDKNTFFDNFSTAQNLGEALAPCSLADSKG